MTNFYQTLENMTQFMLCRLSLFSHVCEITTCTPGQTIKYNLQYQI